MTDKFQNKYRSGSNRMPGWDYAGNGSYFITFVTQHRECNLGHILNGKMVLSDWGKIIENEFLRSFEMRRELFLDESIIMPNHLHAIVILEKIVGTHGRASQPSPKLPPSPQSLKKSAPIFIRKPKSLSSFVAGFKSSVNTKIDDYIDAHQLNIPKYNRHNHFFQPNYHDRIIRNKTAFQRIKQYIINNPNKWDGDNFKSSKPGDD